MSRGDFVQVCKWQQGIFPGMQMAAGILSTFTYRKDLVWKGFCLRGSGDFVHDSFVTVFCNGTRANQEIFIVKLKKLTDNKKGIIPTVLCWFSNQNFCC